MVFAYYECPMLCTLVVNGLAGALKVNSLEPGKDFEVVVVSFDPRDTACGRGDEESGISRALRPRQCRCRYTFPERRAARHPTTDESGRLSLRMG